MHPLLLTLCRRMRVHAGVACQRFGQQVGVDIGRSACDLTQQYCRGGQRAMTAVRGRAECLRCASRQFHACADLLSGSLLPLARAAARLRSSHALAMRCGSGVCSVMLLTGQCLVSA